MKHHALLGLAAAALLLAAAPAAGLAQTVATPTYRAITIDGDFSDWAGIAPVVTLPSIGAGGTGNRIDLKEVYVANDLDHLYVRVKLHQSVSSAAALNLFLDGQTALGTGFYQEGNAWKARVIANEGHQMTGGGWSEGPLAGLDAALSAGPSDDYELRISRHSTFAARMLGATQANAHYAQPVFQGPELRLRLRGNTVDGTYDSSGLISYVLGGANPATPGVVTVFPPYEPGILANPHKGFAPWAAYNPATSAIPRTLAKAAVTWKLLQPTSSSTYDWSALEAGWAPHLAAGRRIGFRMRMALPAVGKTTADIPDWLAALGVPVNSYTVLNQSGLAPDWNHPDLLDHHDALIAALGARYNGSPDIAWVDVGSYGFWGEWHLYQNTTTLPLATEATKRRIIDAYVAAFPNTPLVIPFDDVYAGAYALQPARGVGLRNDCLGTAGSANHYLDYVEQMTYHAANTSAEDLGVTVPLRAMIGGEFCGGETGANTGMDTNYEAILAFVEQTRWSILSGAGGQLVTSTGERLLRSQVLHRRLGYRFRVDSATYPATWVRGTDAAISINWRNEGIAPFFHPWFVRVALINPTTGSIARSWRLGSAVAEPRDWMPDTTTTSTSAHDVTAAWTPAGSYLLAVAIIDPDANTPGIQLSNTGALPNGFLPLGTVQVVDP